MRFGSIITKQSMMARIPGLSRVTVLTALGSVFADAATEMLAPVLPIFLTQSLGASGTVLGLVDGLAQALRNFVDGFSGVISDRIRERKALMIGGYALSALAKPLMGIATFWEAFLAARLLDRLGAGIRSAPRDALVASSVHGREKARGFGLEALGENAGAFLGPLLTLFFLFALQVEIRTVFYIALAPGIVGLLIVSLVSKRRSAGGDRQSTFTLSGLSRSYWKFLVVTAIFSVGNSSNSFLILRSQEIGASVVLVSTLYAGFNLVAALVSYPSGCLADKVGRRLTLLSSFGVFLIVYTGFFVFTNVLGLAVMFLLYGLFQGTFRPVGKALASDCAPDQVRASAIGFFSATVGSMQLVASVLAGLLWQWVSHESVFLLGCATSLVGIVVLLLVIPSQRSPNVMSMQARKVP